jgi:hypothetical protein
MLKYGQEYRDAGERYYEEKYQHHLHPPSPQTSRRFWLPTHSPTQ